jgi:uracil-DNA glycosylase family 4
MLHSENIFERAERFFLQLQALSGDIVYAHALETRSNHNDKPDLTDQDSDTARTTLIDTTSAMIITKPDSQAPVPINAPVTLFSDSILSETEQIRKSNLDNDWKNSPTLTMLYEKIHTCQNCKLGATRTNFVFGTGNPEAALMIIGEAPGADEDAQGEPFVGRGGQLLTKILEAINLKREDVYIANIIKCRPPENRRPEADEVIECEPYLYKQIDLVQPKLILALGLTALNTLLKSKHTMATIRGQILNFRGIPMMATYHPAALLRNPEWKKATWEDVKVLRALLDEIQAKK